MQSGMSVSLSTHIHSFTIEHKTEKGPDISLLMFHLEVWTGKLASKHKRQEKKVLQSHQGSSFLIVIHKPNNYWCALRNKQIPENSPKRLKIYLTMSKNKHISSSQPGRVSKEKIWRGFSRVHLECAPPPETVCSAACFPWPWCNTCGHLQMLAPHR